MLDALTLAALCCASGPAGDAFYRPPSPLPPATHGTVIWTRPLSGGAALPHAGQNLLVLYHTTSVNGSDVAVSGTLAIPRGEPPANGWPVLSWAHGTTGDAPQCAPSKDARPGGEQRMLDAWVQAGYVVARTDYEGEGTPGVHPYFVAKAGARDTADIVRAAREIDSRIGSRWIAMGHSEGGAVALWTAAEAPSWTPDLQLAGAVVYAPGANLVGILENMLQRTQPGNFALFAMMLEGFSSVDPAVRLDRILTPAMLARMADLQSECDDQLEVDPAWSSLVPHAAFLPSPKLDPLINDFVTNEPASARPQAPVLLLQGTYDDTVAPEVTDTLYNMLCSNGAKVTYLVLPGGGHGSILVQSLAQVQTWVAGRFAGAPPVASCERSGG